VGPLVSILIPCYNAEQWISLAIESALAQTWVEKEIIVVDDGSTDRSLDVIRQFEGRIRWRAGLNNGGGAARNRLLELARGEWLQYLDADDYLRPGKIARQIEFVREHPHADVVCSPTAWEGVVDEKIVCVDTEIPKLDPWILLASWRLPQTGGTLWKKKVLESVGGWRVDQTCCQEHELYCRLLEAAMRFEFCDGALAVYRDFECHGRVTRKSRGGELERQRLAILDRIERCLKQRSELTIERRQAVNDARHELARGLWQSNRQFAMNTHKRIWESDPSFLPSPAASNSKFYSIAYRVVGFQVAQIVASCRRALIFSTRLARR
jgi:glycosyltransferase involved in cell wall biosynthesis